MSKLVLWSGSGVGGGRGSVLAVRGWPVSAILLARLPAFPDVICPDPFPRFLECSPLFSGFL
ncbi:hypothetical protein [Thermobifida halotolerans]|uniref:hypothetical protein n=1 Tax=Thermobifida halotolerans TaxID=483545 RepID=UPI0012F52226|nr:hypothetical protein [Thermobifida halotolerans]